MYFDLLRGEVRDEENGKIKFFSRRMQHFPFFPSKCPPSARTDISFKALSVCRQILLSLGLARELLEPALARRGNRSSSAKPRLKAAKCANLLP